MKGACFIKKVSWKGEICHPRKFLAVNAYTIKHESLKINDFNVLLRNWKIETNKQKTQNKLV